ncbi:MAG: Gfo/Idh/MocA family oxidoreductase [Phycisphaeraceae bacterium]|nr:Gfo/Idh/MocA family oxidoreductase [Phycisphaeraceae bacterium]
MPKVALLGCAHIHTPGFLKMLKNRPSVTVAAVWDHDAARAAANAKEANAPVVSDLAVILADKSIDAAIVCSETDRHESLVLPAAAAGKHLFVEKPLGYATADADRMARAIDQAGVHFSTGYFLRGSPVHQFLKHAIADNLFGAITRVRHSNCHNGALGGWFDTQWRWMADPKIAGCGAFGDLATHSLDILLWLMGAVERVAGDIFTVTKRYGDCDEVGEALLKFQNGALATLAGSWLDLDNPVQCLITGTEAHAMVCQGKLYLKSKKLNADGKEPWTNLPKPWPHAFENFLDAVEGKPHAPLVSVREAAARSAVMTAIYQAARDKTWLPVNR